MKTLKLSSELETLKLGERIGERLKTGDLLFLSGDLGAGKTTLTKGIAKGLQIQDEITSPTFQLKKSYRGRYILYHLDLYRIKNENELEIIEPGELTTDGIAVIEWGELLKNKLNHDYLEIHIQFDNFTERQITLEPHGLRFVEMVEELN